MATEMYGMMPRAKNRKAFERAAGEQIRPSEQRAGSRIEKGRERLTVDTWRRHGDADSIHRQHQGCENQPAAQLRDARGA